MADKLALGISGSPSPTSSSRRLIEQALDELRQLGWETDMIDLATLPAAALLARGEHPDVAAAIEHIGETQILVVGTPVYRATYTALLKTIFDLMPQDHLTGKIALLIATGAAPGHMLAIDHGLRPLIASLNGMSAAHAVYALSSDFVDGVPSSDLSEQVSRAVLEVDRLAS